MKTETLTVILLFGIEAVFSYPGSRTAYAFVKVKNARDYEKKMKRLRKFERNVGIPEKPKNKSHISMLDLRTGQIIATKVHPADDTLYVSKIDIGNGTIKIANSSNTNEPSFTRFKTHSNCRNNKYFTTNFTFRRFDVPDDKVAWSTNYSWYFPLYFNEHHDEPWVDKYVKQTEGPDMPHPKYNSMDGLINRISHHGPYHVSKNGFPYNPVGRTGICGRGVLGRWGPNHAVIVFVTTWAREGNNINNYIILNADTSKPMLQFIGLLYRCKEDLHWLAPGGFIEPGESIDDAAKREFLEEALDYEDEEKTELERKMLRRFVDKFFKNGIDVYKGYSDDPRNTDNSWVEVVVKHFHDQTGEQVSAFPLAAGENFADAGWANFNEFTLQVAPHQKQFFQLIAESMGAHW